MVDPEGRSPFTTDARRSHVLRVAPWLCGQGRPLPADNYPKIRYRVLVESGSGRTRCMSSQTIEATNNNAPTTPRPTPTQNVQSPGPVLSATISATTEMARRPNTPGPSESHPTYQGRLRPGTFKVTQSIMDCRRGVGGVGQAQAHDVQHDVLPVRSAAAGG